MEEEGLVNEVCNTDPNPDPEEHTFLEYLNRPPPRMRERTFQFPPFGSGRCRMPPTSDVQYEDMGTYIDPEESQFESLTAHLRDITESGFHY
jgi:hypothetical protein